MPRRTKNNVQDAPQATEEVINDSAYLYGDPPPGTALLIEVAPVSRAGCLVRINGIDSGYIETMQEKGRNIYRLPDGNYTGDKLRALESHAMAQIGKVPSGTLFRA